MKTWKLKLLPAIWLFTLGLSAVPLIAQGGGGGGGGGAAPPPLTPVYQKILDSERRAMLVTNEDEWQVIAPQLLKVVQLKLEEHTMDVRLLFGSAFPRGGGVVRGGRAGSPVEVRALTGLLPAVTEPEVDGLMQLAMSDQTNLSSLNASLARLRTARKKRQADMAKAEADLRAILTHRQETVLESRGILEMPTDKGVADPAGTLLVNFDPALQRIMATNRIFLAVTNDDDWKVISSRLLPVLKMKINAYMVSVNSLFLLNGISTMTQVPPGRPDAGLDLGVRALTGELTVSLDPAEHALRRALEIHAPPDELTAAEAYAKAARTQRQAVLTQEQSDLLDILTRKQEALLVGLGMLE